MSEMAVYIVHASLLLIFLGGIVDGALRLARICQC